MENELKKRIKSEVKKFISKNKSNLPFSSDYWSIEVQEIIPEPIPSMGLGKYNSDIVIPTILYKPISRLINCDLFNE